jgi:uncharacterized GH25 family protein
MNFHSHSSIDWIRALLAPCAVAVALSVLGRAHDCWLQPSSYRPALQDKLEVSIQVGVAWKGEEQVRNPLRIERLVQLGSKGERPIVGIDGKVPAGLLRATVAGPTVLAYQSHSAFLENLAPKFEAYLHEEGLERIVDERKAKAESDKPVRELYMRCAKALVRVDGQTGAEFLKPVGLRFELVPLVDPHTERKDDKFGVQLSFDGKPSEGILVMAQPKSAPEKVQKLRSDAQGRVEFDAIGADTWLIKAVHMERAADPAKADWQSYWASLTFEVQRGADAK